MARYYATGGRVPDLIYFVQAHGNGPIKIGCSSDPEARLVQMQTCCPYELVLRCVFNPFQDVYIFERELHVRFATARLRGEWFTATQELCDYINLLVRKQAA